MVSQASQPKIRYKRRFVEVQYFVEHLSDEVGIEMMRIPGGTFEMGSLDNDSEKPVHTVMVPEFCMGKYPVTQAQWRYVAGMPQVNQELEAEPSYFKGDKRPVERVSWYDAVEFCERLSRETGRVYRLPTEAEWEYACRAGTTTTYHFGETITKDLASYERSEEEGTTPVDHYGIANAFGLSDMHGNVREWCQDHWHDSYEGAPTDGSAWLTDNEKASRVRRGGSWGSYQRSCRSAYFNNPVNRFSNYGFRVVCGVPRT